MTQWNLSLKLQVLHLTQTLTLNYCVNFPAELNLWLALSICILNQVESHFVVHADRRWCQVLFHIGFVWSLQVSGKITRKLQPSSPFRFYGTLVVLGVAARLLHQMFGWRSLLTTCQHGHHLVMKQVSAVRLLPIQVCLIYSKVQVTTVSATQSMMCYSVM